MKKLTFGILCLGVCACLALSSCSKPEEENTDNAAGDTQNSDLAGIVLPKDEDEEVVVYEYDWSSDGATLIAYNAKRASRAARLLKKSSFRRDLPRSVRVRSTAVIR